MMKLSQRRRALVARTYRQSTGREPRWISPAGAVETDESPVFRLPVVTRTLADALREAVRWGEPHVFFLLPGVLSWIVARVDGDVVQGGITGGEVAAHDDPADAAATVAYLVSSGCPREDAERFVSRLPEWPYDRVRRAAKALQARFYEGTGQRPLLLDRNRANAAQQRQIAEEIHVRKNAHRRTYPYDEERMLLSLIRVGDKRAARRLLNEVLAAMFVYSPRVAVLRVRAIELCGYLVRTVVENDPQLEPLIEEHQKWIERMVAADDFEAVCAVVRDALDEFLDRACVQAESRTSAPVGRALHYLSQHYAERCTLSDVARAAHLSSFRIAHLVKETTGRSVWQHVKRLRVQKAEELLERTDLSCAEIARAVGFSDQSYMIKQFSSLTGRTPARFRREVRAGLYAAMPNAHNAPTGGEDGKNLARHVGDRSRPRL
jgi:AraC-like DNA-binding protein